MNKLSYKKRTSGDKWCTSPDFYIVIDGEKGLFCFDIGEFVKSSKKSGNYRIAICSCGEELCGCAVIKVIHKENTIIWDKVIEHCEPEKNFKIDKPLVFDKYEYCKLAESLLSETKAMTDTEKQENGLD